jgi:hypothetical protein
LKITDLNPKGVQFDIAIDRYQKAGGRLLELADILQVVMS